jgi:hypothetical protein
MLSFSFPVVFRHEMQEVLFEGRLADEMKKCPHLTDVFLISLCSALNQKSRFPKAPQSSRLQGGNAI